MYNLVCLLFSELPHDEVKTFLHRVVYFALEHADLAGLCF